jgi:hypothetical protein
LLKVYRFSTGDLVLGKYPGKQSPFVTGSCGSSAASVIRQQAAYSVEKLGAKEADFRWIF